MHLASAAMFVGGQLRRVPRWASAPLDRYPRAGDPLLKELAARALDAAKAAGATYADVRFSLTDQENMGVGFSTQWDQGANRHQGAVGVRALAGGAWGFATSENWTAEEMVRLGREAAELSRRNGRGRRTPIEWTAQPAVTGQWVAPVKIDPFTVPLGEKMDVLFGWARQCMDGFTQQYTNAATYGFYSYQARRQETTFVSAEGSFLTQTRYMMHPSAGVLYNYGNNIRYANRTLERLQPGAAGWEVMIDPTLFDEIPLLLEEAQQSAEGTLPDPNRYDIVCDATIVAQLLAQTVGVATELDRVLGYEANAGGTSYLAPSEDMLGQFALGPVSLNVTANRSMPGMLGTTKWDDEGVEPQEYPVIKNGIVVGYHTTRELAPTLAAWDTKQGRAVRSRGCAAAASAEHLPVVQPSNLVMVPTTTDTTFDELIAGLEHGLVFVGGRSPTNQFEGGISSSSMTNTPNKELFTYRDVRTVTVDRQQLNGELHADLVYEVRQGKRVRTLQPTRVEALFRAPELWKKLQAIGGASTQRNAGYFTRKGEPGQDGGFGVRACAARFKQIAVTDRQRKA